MLLKRVTNMKPLKNLLNQRRLGDEVANKYPCNGQVNLIGKPNNGPAELLNHYSQKIEIFVKNKVLGQGLQMHFRGLANKEIIWKSDLTLS